MKNNKRLYIQTYDIPDILYLTTTSKQKAITIQNKCMFLIWIKQKLVMFKIFEREGSMNFCSLFYFIKPKVIIYFLLIIYIGHI